MSAIRDGRLPIELDTTRHLLFSLNVIDEVQDKFGGIDKLGEALQGKGNMRNLRWLLTLLFNEGADDGEPQLTEREVGKMIHMGNITMATTAVFSALAVGNHGTTEPHDNEPTDDDEDDEGNAQAGGV